VAEGLLVLPRMLLARLLLTFCWLAKGTQSLLSEAVVVVQLTAVT
jgi:hypothetical protein